ncbi:uncharacterized protein B0H18DRAFT_1095244 [Fomitopsis serialis]|uniref:uncharacterized protein n=1 Tax=Fomitopsis serialis TaxID=139415 RepID=UPI0020072B46|nr:uncharacterized protein B0H18DRAFT_1095244 [Neoantrodia serialis]KAH9923619.1 hypothetical protein B0H18DRAFT_1095244 [Neoantrodia serialis]
MAAMAQAYMQPNKGTLVAGQTIAVNKYTVQVERYLSQGGFAHVYLVRTATPVMNTTHHVLKRIAVPNEGMLTEVKKEVDIMRILKGHANIVYLIDAAWHRLPNGTYEVFILMEFCAGGGIIDMMNRRLRERLTEPEILTIFCDVCEGLAAMHSLKPPLLHRDLKVENILQASSTSYKLCDFGSATSVQKVPSNVQEIRMLEADLNRHTTLQYRAPEMVDVYLRRPVDEKSDVWALGVLLYKLCYYTTPFEEHGPLAILNVQYKIPPYPVYSQQMNTLIASMLREHGAQRPSVFELLDHVHRLRGTKSRFTYNIPPKAPPLSPTRASASPLQTLSPNVASPPLNPLDDFVSRKSQQAFSASPARNAGIEAREKVLEAIAPMRRGRPPGAAPSSPTKERAFEMDMKFGADDDRVWRGVKGHKSGLAAVNAGSNYAQRDNADAWGMGRKEPQKESRPSFEKGFGDDFSFGKSFGDSFQPARSPLPSPQPQPQPSPSPRPPSMPTGLNRHASMRKAKDAFDGLGLGLSAQAPPPTLGEARMSRTGLASIGMTSGGAAASYFNAHSSQAPGLGTNNTSFRPPSSHSPMPSSSPRPMPQVPATQATPSWRPSPSKGETLTAEERFPSLEELDREFGSPSPGTAAERFAMAHAPTQPPSTEKLATGSRPPSRTAYMANARSTATNGATGAGSSAPNVSTFTGVKRTMYEGLGARSQNVTGTAMRESRFSVAQAPSHTLRPPQVSAEPPRSRERERPRSPQKQKQDEDKEKPQDVVAVLRSRPSAARRHRTTGSKTPSRNNSANLVSPVRETMPVLPPRPPPEPSPRAGPRDWLTGADEDEAPPRPEPQPVMRESPSKRASFIERSPIQLVKPLEAEEVLASYEKPERGGDPQKSTAARKPTSNARPNWDRKEPEREREKSREERQPRTTSSASASGAGSANTRVLQIPPVDTRIPSRTGTTPSPNGLTENWSPIASTAEPVPLTAKSSSSGSSEEGPEDVSGFGAARKKKAGEEQRQTESVHDLVDLWGGSLAEKKEKEPTRSTASSRIVDTSKRRSVIMPAPIARPPPLTSKPTRSEQIIEHGPPSKSTQEATLRRAAIRPRMQATPMASASSMPPPMSGRSRPQSMFITSPSKSAYSLQQSAPAPSPAPTTLALAPPPDPRPRAGRRSSISDMVQHYEAITSAKPTTTPTPAPTSPTKSAPLNVRSRSSAGAGAGADSLASPSAAATRFPKLSPTTSPVLSKTNLAVPDDAGQGRAERENGRRSPGLSGLPSPNGVVNGLPGRRSPLQMARESLEQPPPSPFGGRKPTLQSSREPVRSPSPERPYQGCRS